MGLTYRGWAQAAVVAPGYTVHLNCLSLRPQPDDVEQSARLVELRQSVG